VFRRPDPPSRGERRRAACWGGAPPLQGERRQAATRELGFLRMEIEEGRERPGRTGMCPKFTPGEFRGRIRQR
jgi:hypothetical protein